MRIIFFDGNCPMCHAWVRRIIRWDKKRVFRFSPLEGELARTTLSSLFPGYLQEDTIVYYDDGKIFLRSDAALKIAGVLGFPFQIGAIGWMVPRFLRDAVYRQVAANRYKFGKRYDACPVPPQEWKELFK